MNEKQIIEFLNFFFKEIKDEQLNYRFAGDFALFIQGMEILPKNISIICDNFSFVEFKYLFDKYLIQNGRKDELKEDYFIVKFKNLQVNFMNFDDEKISMLDKVYKVSWNGLELNVISLLETKYFYELTNQLDKVQKIQNYLNQSKNRI